ncbi:MAG: gamma-glutamyltransferase [Deltaproteobacteria bacterium]|nr:gamma-glutamyltransferase [Deltaproteobacteria bacterium]
MSLARKLQGVIVSLFIFFLPVGTIPTFAQQNLNGVVVSDNLLATRAGMEILEKGGNAVDAAVATAFALGVVNPASSGLGGGGFMVIYQAKEKKAHTLDFREMAPKAAGADTYVREGRVVPELSRSGVLSIAVPGEVAGLTEALKRFGSLSLETVMAPAIRYATEGFPVHPQLFNAVKRHLTTIRKLPNFSRLFLKSDGTPYKEGETIHQPELGETLKAIARKGPRVFYEGWIAQAIVSQLKKVGGVLTLEDLKEYKPVWREPILGSYRNRPVITMPPPSSGGIALVQMLNVLEGYQLNQFRHNSAPYLHLLTEVMKHAFADRAKYLGDPDFVQVPIKRLLSKEYASWIRNRISSEYTHPAGFYGLAPFKPKQGGTTHFGVLDGEGNAVSSSLTINTRFGARVLVRETGVILNNEIDDFSIRSGFPNVYGLVGGEANSIRPKKRPLSSMAPTIILQEDRPILIVGGSGGPRIISATLQTILNALDFGMPLKKAIGSPRIHHQWKPNKLLAEKKISRETRNSLARKGHAIKIRPSLGAVQAILVDGEKISGEADPRKTKKRSGK